MKNNDFLKIFSIIAFIAFMLVSCWATVESLHMSLLWPKPFFWVVTIGLFVISSLGTKLIVDSFNQRIRVDNRGGHLIGGVMILLIFWIMFSLPTNTHTFFYNAKVRTVVQSDIKRTESYLQQLSNNSQVADAIKAAQTNYEEKVWDAFRAFKQEIENPGNVGYGPEARNRLTDLNAVLGGEPLQLLKGNFSTAIKRQQLIAQYQELVNEKVEKKKVEIAKSMTPQDVTTFKASADNALKKLETVEKVMAEYKKKGEIIPPKVIREQIEPVINNGYKVISANRNYVEFLKDAKGQYVDRDVYTEKRAANGEIIEPETKTLRLFNVLSVWQDFFKGRYKGMGFYYWILIAVLVDLAGFIFFDIAFRRTE